MTIEYATLEIMGNPIYNQLQSIELRVFKRDPESKTNES